MRIQTTEELCTVDEMSQRATPYGFGLDCMLTPDGAVAAHQDEIAGCELVERVPDPTREAFERACLTHTYGVFAYDLYTVAHNHTRLVLELALRERFVEWSGGAITLVRQSKAGEAHAVTADVTRYTDVTELFDRDRGVCRRGSWDLETTSGSLRFNPGLASLMKWARHIGLFHGQRNRGREQAMLDLRNYVAHPEGPLTVGPSDSARTIVATAELINQLYGASTPGGDMYPPATPRTPVFTVQEEPGSETRRAEHLNDRALAPDASVICFLIAETDPGLLHANSWYETTAIPSRYLWGPGTPAEATAWTAITDIATDETDHHDRLFVIDCSRGHPANALRAEIAVALDHNEPGRWLIVRADQPGDAKSAASIYLGLSGHEGHPTYFDDQIIYDGAWLEVAGQIADLSDPGRPVTPEPVAAGGPWSALTDVDHTLAP